MRLTPRTIADAILSVTLALTLSGAAACSLAGCSSPSLQGLTPAQSLVEDPGLTGEWVTEGRTVTRVTISPGAGRSYRGTLTVAHDGEFKTGLDVEIRLTDIDSQRYADLYLAKAERDRLIGRYGFLVLPVHQFMALERQGDTIRVWTFNSDWLRRAADAERFPCVGLPLGEGDVPVITADVDAMRAFLARRGRDPGARADPLIFRRVIPVSRPDSGG
ncbi:MAG: hypothetical protein ACK51N_03965 [bacterium]|jgi:hypothetical protein|nr:hypothetical protein [Planctomycetaceae bacterium]